MDNKYTIKTEKLVEEFRKENPKLAELYLTEDVTEIHKLLKSKNRYYEAMGLFQITENFYVYFGEILNEFFNKHNIKNQEEKNKFLEL